MYVYLKLLVADSGVTIQDCIILKLTNPKLNILEDDIRDGSNNFLLKITLQRPMAYRTVSEVYFDHNMTKHIKCEA